MTAAPRDERGPALTDAVSIRPFRDADAAAVRDLFIAVNRSLAPPDMRDVFEASIARSLTEEIDRIREYYAARDGGFWVALRAARLVGNFGLERSGPETMELRRMYVAPAARRSGIARMMLHFAEVETRTFGARRLELSTSELQPAAIQLYRHAGYRLVREAIAAEASNKTVGGGIRRYYFDKDV